MSAASCPSRLSPDMSRAIVTARMNREVAPYLDSGTHFWIVRPQVTATGISGLTTILSGAYIEMDPGSGAPAKEFKGFDEETALLKPAEPGRGFVLVAGQLGSIAKESKITYHGMTVGQVLGTRLDPDGQEDRDHHPHFRALRQSGDPPDPFLERERPQHRVDLVGVQDQRRRAGQICSRAAPSPSTRPRRAGGAGAEQAGQQIPALRQREGRARRQGALARGRNRPRFAVPDFSGFWQQAIRSSSS